MYKIERTSYGFLLTFGGEIVKQEMEQWLKDSEQALMACTGPFGLIVDKTTLEPLAPDAQVVLLKGHRLYQEKGIRRIAVALKDLVTSAQSNRLANQSGISASEKCIDASVHTNWKRLAEDWVQFGIDPNR